MVADEILQTILEQHLSRFYHLFILINVPVASQDVLLGVYQMFACSHLGIDNTR